eukprot:3305543-Pyramimonas_sp.AAC.1
MFYKLNHTQRFHMNYQTLSDANLNVNLRFGVAVPQTGAPTFPSTFKVALEQGPLPLPTHLHLTIGATWVSVRLIVIKFKSCGVLGTKSRISNVPTKCRSILAHSQVEIVYNKIDPTSRFACLLTKVVCIQNDEPRIVQAFHKTLNPIPRLSSLPDKRPFLCSQESDAGSITTSEPTSERGSATLEQQKVTLVCLLMSWKTQPGCTRSQSSEGRGNIPGV